MDPTVTTALQRALRVLEREGQQLDRQIAALRTVLGGSEARLRPARVPSPPPASPAPRPQMSRVARQAVSQRMKAYWAQRKRMAGKGKATPA